MAPRYEKKVKIAPLKRKAVSVTLMQSSIHTVLVVIRPNELTAKSTR